MSFGRAYPKIIYEHSPVFNGILEKCLSHLFFLQLYPDRKKAAIRICAPKTNEMENWDLQKQADICFAKKCSSILESYGPMQ